jgi:hypothetical protein
MEWVTKWTVSASPQASRPAVTASPASASMGFSVESYSMFRTR